MAEQAADGTVYEMSGPERAPVVALIHGLGLCRQMWQWHREPLATRYRVLSYDLYGHGDSGPPPRPPTLTLFSGQLIGLLDRLGVEAAAIVGFSLGGMINRRFALDCPERTRALAILNSPHERSPEAQKAVEERAALAAGGGSAATLESAIERWFTPEFRAGRPDVIAQVRQWRGLADPQSYPQCCQVLARGVLELVRPRPPIQRPCKVMTTGEDTGSTPAMAHAIASEIEGAETIIVPGLRHMGLVEQPTRFTDPLMDFLDASIERGSAS